MKLLGYRIGTFYSSIFIAMWGKISLFETIGNGYVVARGAHVIRVL